MAKSCAKTTNRMVWCAANRMVWCAANRMVRCVANRMVRCAAKILSPAPQFRPSLPIGWSGALPNFGGQLAYTCKSVR
ncbi:MAG: hypothetical protein AAF587_37680 [Bacteroidota bacterium]